MPKKHYFKKEKKKVFSPSQISHHPPNFCLSLLLIHVPFFLSLSSTCSTRTPLAVCVCVGMSDQCVSPDVEEKNSISTRTRVLCSAALIFVHARILSFLCKGFSASTRRRLSFSFFTFPSLSSNTQNEKPCYVFSSTKQRNADD